MAKHKQVFDFDGEKLEASWDGRLCIHVGECTRAKGELFVSGRKPWGQPARGHPDPVAAVIERCPTGALVHRRKDGGPAETADPRNSVLVANQGPLYLRGDLQIDGAEEEMSGTRFRAALCRCGGSKNKPFCDGAHETNDFNDRGAVGESGDGFEAGGGPLTVSRAKDGPLLLSGNFEITNGAGRTTWRGTKAALCRCGQSQNKPFCDGAHKAAGFQAD